MRFFLSTIATLCHCRSIQFAQANFSHTYKTIIHWIFALYDSVDVDVSCSAFIYLFFFSFYFFRVYVTQTAEKYTANRYSDTLIQIICLAISSMKTEKKCWCVGFCFEYCMNCISMSNEAAHMLYYVVRYIKFNLKYRTTVITFQST